MRECQDGVKFLMRLLSVGFAIAAAMTWTEVQAQAVVGDISRVGDTTHLEFRGLKDWQYQTQPGKDRIVVTTPKFDDSTVVRLQGWSCPLIKEVQVNKNAPDGQYEVIFHLASPEVESFDYLTDDPSYLIFDFYKQTPKEKPKPVAETPSSAPKPAKRAAAKKVTKLPEKLPPKIDAKDEYTKVERKPAGSETLSVAPPITPSDSPFEDSSTSGRFERGVFDGGDPNYDRFRIKDYQVREEAIIASKQNIYIRFPILALQSAGFEELMKTPPEYEIKPDGTEENKEARFLLSLFEKRKWGSFFETLGYFEKKHPNSKYNEIVKNLKAEAHVWLYERDRDPKDYDSFRSLYRFLVEVYPDSALTERNELLLAYSSLAHKDGAETLRDFQRYLLKHPRSPERDKIRIAMSEAYVLLNKPDDAIRTYNEVVKDPLDRARGIEAEYRIGDVHFGLKDYEKAIASYTRVHKEFPQFRSVFPNAQYNLAESQFWLGKHRESLEEFIRFLELFPSHQHGGFALTRIGELIEILGGDQRQIIGAFIEGYFRYPDSQGSEVARIRMLSQGLKSMKEREKKRALAEIDGIAQKSTLPQIQEFAVLMKSDGLSRRGESRNSLDLLLSHYQAHPTTTNLKVFRSRILRNIADVLKGEAATKNYIEALNFYGKYSTTWLKNADRLDVLYFQAQAFEQAQVRNEAKKIYLQVLSKLKAIAGKPEQKERMVYEHLPTISQVNLRLASIALDERNYQESFKQLSLVKDGLSPEENIEKVQIGSAVTEQMGDIKSAIANLERLISGYKDETALTDSRISLARLYLKENKTAEADRHLADLEKRQAASSSLTDEQWSKVLELRGDLLLAKKEKLAAVEAYGRLLESFEGKFPLSSIRYKAGKILFDEGDLKGAEKMWSRFGEGTGEFYKKLAAEKLGQANWQDNYRKYIDRIPAAQDLK